MRKIVIAAALAGATTLSGVALATQTHAAKADANGDGAISRAEFLARADATFARLDTDRNGSLTREEHRARRGYGKHAGAVGTPIQAATGDDMRPGRGAMLQRFDTDGDGKLSRSEYAGQVARRWQRIDANGNGTIDVEERRGGRAMAAVTDRASFDKEADRRFARIDSNGDGFIDSTEASAIGRGVGRGRGGTRPGTPAPTPPPAPDGN